MPISDPPFTSPQLTPRFDTIDLLRGLSILGVVLLHICIRFYFAGIDVRASRPEWLFHLLFRQGGNGVIVFFAISGFLITYTSIGRFGDLSRLKPSTFYRIRFARIGPPLLLLLAVFTVLHLAHVEAFVVRHGTLPGALLSALTFTLNWYEAVHGWLPACWTVLWSLSIEEMFYLFFPLVCVLLLRRGRAGFWLFLILLAACVVVSPFARTVWAGGNDIWAENNYLGGTGPIALGCLTALLAERMQPRRPSRATILTLQALGALLVAWMIAGPRLPWILPLMHPIAAAGFDGLMLPLVVCLIMLISVLRRTQATVFTAPIRWFGRHSYEVYLTHEFVVIWGVELYVAFAKSHRPGPLALWFAAILLLTAPLGWLLARFFSEPLNRRLRPRTSPLSLS